MLLGLLTSLCAVRKTNKFASGVKNNNKIPTVTVMNGRLVGRKHPENDHHANYEPSAKSVIDALDADREIRNSVSSTGKRPQDAYAEAVGLIPKKVKSSAEQEAVIVNFPAYHEFGV